MADNVEGLVIEIESQSNNAVSNLDALSASLERLRSTVSSSTPMRTFARNFESMTTAINNSTMFDHSKIESIRYFSDVMNKLNSITVKSSIGKNIEAMNTSIQGINVEGLSKMTELINMVTQLNQLKDVKISSALVKNMKELADFSQQLQNYDFTKLNEFTSALANMGSLANVDSSAVKGLSTSIKNLGNNTRTATSRGRTFNTVLANIRTKTVAILMVTRRLSQYTMKAMSVYGNYVEALNLYKMALGSAAEAEYEFAEKAQALLGIDLTQWMQAQGVFNALASGFGVASDKAALMSRNLTQLAYDISSFYNISVEDAIQKVQSGFAGQIRPVRNLGYDLSQARLEAIALANGIDKEVKSMTQAEKSQLRYIALMTQLTQVQGDLSRTIDSPTNQMRLLNAQLDQMTRSIGMVLLPILNKVIPYLNAIFRVIKMIAEEIAAMFGYTLPRISGSDWTSSVSMGAEELEEDLDDANGAAEKLKNTLASFDQINLITSKSGGSGSGSGASSVGGTDLGLDLPSYDFLGDAGENKAQQIANNIMKALRDPIDWLKAFILFTVDNLGTIMQIIETLAVVSIGKNLINKLGEATGLANLFKERWGEVVNGLGLITIGLQFSYLGGKDLAKGNWFEGILKSTIGVGVAALGGYIAFGVGGLFVSIPLAIGLIIEGYKDAKYEELMKTCEEIFYKFDDARMSVDEFRESWQKTLEAFNDPELTETLKVSESLHTEVDKMGGAVDELFGNYISGTMTAEVYAAAITGTYQRMSDAIITSTQHAVESINQALEGELGLWLSLSGKSVSRAKELAELSQQEIEKEIERIKGDLEELNKAYANGLPEEEYKTKMSELVKELGKYYDQTKINSVATEQFQRQFTGINFSSVSDMKDLLLDVQKGYNDTLKTLGDNRVSLIADMESLLPGLVGKDKEEWQAYIDETKKFFDNQEKNLGESYRSVIEQIEETGYVNWDRVVDKQGFKAAMQSVGGDMIEVDNQIAKMFDDENLRKHGIKRNETFFTQARDLMKEHLNLVFRGSTKGEEIANEQAKRLNDIYRMSILERENALGELTDREKIIWEKYKNEYYKVTKTVGKETKIQNDLLLSKEEAARHYVATYGKSMSDVEDATHSATEYMTGETELMSYQFRLLGDTFSDSSVLVDPLTETMYETAQVLTDSDMKNRFITGATSILTGMANVLGDPNNSARVALVNGLTVSESSTKTIGKKFGDGIATGLKSSEGDIKVATNSVIKSMVDGFNKFGDGLADYLKAISDAVTGTLNGLNIGFTMSPTSTFTVNKKALKIKGYASGGFPNSADFFFANENGVPEYVGTMGGKTAVANNQEITKGVADGVYKAIKDTGLINDVKKIASKDGKVVFAPSEEAGKVMTQSVGMYNGTGGRY